VTTRDGTYLVYKHCSPGLPPRPPVLHAPPRRQGRPWLADTVRAGHRLQEGGAFPERRPQSSTWTERPAGQCGQPHQGDGRRCVRGPVDQAESHPPAAEKEAEPEQAKARIPESPDAVVPAAAWVQEGRDIGERGSRSHRRCFSPWLGAYVQRIAGAPRSPQAPARWRWPEGVTRGGRAPGLGASRCRGVQAPPSHDPRDKAYADTARPRARPARAGAPWCAIRDMEPRVVRYTSLRCLSSIFALFCSPPGTRTWQWCIFGLLSCVVFDTIAVAFRKSLLGW
jgi:hypothetical protein